MIDVDAAQRLLAAAANPLGTETVLLADAHRRVLARDVIATINSPSCATSSMDGYAVREGKWPATLRVVGQSLPGKGFGTAIAAGECVRIFTGAPLPAGADRVVMQEMVERDGDNARFPTMPSPSRFIRRVGSDFAAGDVLVERGTLLTPGALVAAAAADCGDLIVQRRPCVRILATGDELAEPGRAGATPGAIPDSVSVAVAALVNEWGGEVTDTVRLRDDLPALKTAARDSLKAADLIVVCGGASVGERDFARAMFADEDLEVIFSKVAIKPGKPVWLGRAGGRLVLGLPGNPTSALVTARLFLAPLLCALTGRDPRAALAWRRLPLAHDLQPTGERETFGPGVEQEGAVRLFDDQESSAQKRLATARLLVRLPPGTEPVAAGTRVAVLDL